MQQPDLMIGKKQFKRQGHTYVMGILNVTPDSFSDGGSYPELSDALYRVEQMMKEGAELIDVGGESTRPGYIQITDEEEIARTCPVIEAIKKNFDVPVSLDTYKSEVAKAGVQAGMDLFNDIWGMILKWQRLLHKADCPAYSCITGRRRWGMRSKQHRNWKQCSGRILAGSLRLQRRQE